MRNPSALVFPFRFREGYPDEIVDEHTGRCVSLLEEMDLDYEIAQNIIHPKDADEVKKKFNPSHFDFTILLIPTWIEPVLALRAIQSFAHLPAVIWGLGTFQHKGERVNLGSIPGSGVVKGTLREMGIQHEYVYDLPGDKTANQRIMQRIQRVANVSRAISEMNHTRIVSIGYLFGGMGIGDMDILKMRREWGPEIVELDAYSLISRMEKVNISSEYFTKNVKEIEENVKNPLGTKMEKIARMYSVLEQIVEENQAQALTIKCHFELSQEFGLTACIPLSILGNSIVASCEADIPVLLTQILLKYLSGGETATYADVHEILEDRILVAACGFAPACMCIGKQAIADLPSAAPEGLGATFGDYITNKNYLEQGPVTLARILKDPDGGFTIHWGQGYAVGDVGRVSELGAPQYPFTEIRMEGSTDEFAQEMGSHHYALVYADLHEEIDAYCRLKGIRQIVT